MAFMKMPVSHSQGLKNRKAAAGKVSVPVELWFRVLSKTSQAHNKTLMH